MRRALLVALSLAAVSACKKKEEPAGAAAGTGTGTAAGTGAGTQAPAPADADTTAEAPARPPLPPAPAPTAATDDECLQGSTFLEPSFRQLLLDASVPNDKVDGATTKLIAAFAEQCSTTDWPTTAVHCLLRNSADAFSWRRCIERLPAAPRRAWEDAFASIATTAGGKAEAPATATAEGTPFEELCPTFVAEMARLERCAGMAYSPSLEQVYGERRRVEVGGVIPAADADALRSLCETRAQSANRIAARMCPREADPQ